MSEICSPWQTDYRTTVEFEILDSKNQAVHQVSRNLQNDLNPIISGTKGAKTYKRVIDNQLQESLSLKGGDYHTSFKITPKILNSESKNLMEVTVELKEGGFDKFTLVFTGILSLFISIICWFVWIGNSRSVE